MKKLFILFIAVLLSSVAFCQPFVGDKYTGNTVLTNYKFLNETGTLEIEKVGSVIVDIVFKCNLENTPGNFEKIDKFIINANNKYQIRLEKSENFTGICSTWASESNSGWGAGVYYSVVVFVDRYEIRITMSLTEISKHNLDVANFIENLDPETKKIYEETKKICEETKKTEKTESSDNSLIIKTNNKYPEKLELR